jgi:RNA recognition motif-containing protein
MSWTQVYVTGLSRSVSPTDEEIENDLCQKYSLAADEGGGDAANNNLMWVGPGSTLIKRDENGCCRGFAFLSFYSVDGATTVVERINNSTNARDKEGDSNIRLRAELSNPKGGSKKKSSKKNDGDDLPDLRLRRQRKQPVRKHPVITSSDGKRTNLGNKTK